MFRPDPVESIPQIAVRYFLFTLAVFAAIFVIFLLVPRHGVGLFSEGSPLEWGQFVMMVCAAMVFLWAAAAAPGLRRLSCVLACFPGLAAARELDSFFDALIPFFGWQLPFYIILAIGLVVAFGNREEFFQQLPVLCAHRSFALMWSGLMIVIPFAQLVGHGPFLKELFGDDYVRPMKRMIEEVAETIGYVVIVCAAVDWKIYSGKVGLPRGND